MEATQLSGKSLKTMIIYEKMRCFKYVGEYDDEDVVLREERKCENPVSPPPIFLLFCDSPHLCFCFIPTRLLFRVCTEIAIQPLCRIQSPKLEGEEWRIWKGKKMENTSYSAWFYLLQSGSQRGVWYSLLMSSSSDSSSFLDEK